MHTFPGYLAATRAMHNDEAMGKASVGKMQWFLFTNHDLSAMCSYKQPNRYTAAVWTNLTHVHRRILDQVKVEEEIMIAARTSATETVSMINDASRYNPLNVYESAMEFVNTQNLDTIMAFIAPSCCL
jgi:hypothetical protein